MVILGVIIILIAVGLGVLLFMGTASLAANVDVNLLGGTLSVPPVALLVAGMVLVAILWFGWFLLRIGTKRSHRRRVARKEAEREAEERRLADEARMKEEVAARERQLEEERRRHEEEAARLRHEADERVAEQHVSTETARRRAEVAEARASRTEGETSAPRRDHAGSTPGSEKTSEDADSRSASDTPARTEGERTETSTPPAESTR